MPLSNPSRRLKKFAFLWKWAALRVDGRGVYNYTLVRVY